jgi:hypothetical protein
MQRSGMKHLVYVPQSLDSSLRSAPVRMTFLYLLKLFKHPLKMLTIEVTTLSLEVTTLSLEVTALSLEVTALSLEVTTLSLKIKTIPLNSALKRRCIEAIARNHGHQ